MSDKKLPAHRTASGEPPIEQDDMIAALRPARGSVLGVHPLIFWAGVMIAGAFLTALALGSERMISAGTYLGIVENRIDIMVQAADGSTARLRAGIADEPEELGVGLSLLQEAPTVEEHGINAILYQLGPSPAETAPESRSETQPETQAAALRFIGPNTFPIRLLALSQENQVLADYRLIPGGEVRLPIGTTAAIEAPAQALPDSSIVSITGLQAL